MHWGRGAALCQRSTQYLQALGKLDKPCLFSPPRLFPNCLCEGQSQHQQSGQGQMALVSWPGAGQPRRPWMGQLSCPRSQGRMMAGQASPPQRVLVIGRGTQGEKEKESKGRQVTTDGAAAGVTRRREAEAVHTPSTSKSSSCWGQGSCACTGGCVEALQEHCVSYYQSSLWGGTGRGRFGWPAGLSFGTPLTVKKQSFWPWQWPKGSIDMAASHLTSQSQEKYICSCAGVIFLAKTSWGTPRHSVWLLQHWETAQPTVCQEFWYRYSSRSDFHCVQYFCHDWISKWLT